MIALRPYQEPIKTQAIEILQEHGFVYLVMEMRTGKTPTSFAILQALCAKSITFLTTKNAKPGINKTYKKLFTDNYDEGDCFGLNLIHYDALPKLLAEGWTPPSPYLVIDESHLLGAFPVPSDREVNNAALVQRMYEEYGDAVKVIFLSGTPNPEGYVQMYHQMNVLGSNNPFGTREQFIEHYTTTKQTKIYRYPQPPIERTIYTASKERVMDTMAPYYISLTQKEAGFKQEVVDERYMVQIQGATNQHIANLIHNGETMIGGLLIKPSTAGQVKNKMHQLSGGTLKYEVEHPDTGKVLKGTLLLDDSKIQYIKQNFNDKKIAIYYQYIGEGDMLKQAYDGMWTDNDDEFNDCTDKVYIGQFKSKREGVDLQTADYLIAYNVDYAALSYLQFRQRHQWFDRTTPAKVAWLFSTYGLESKIYPKVMLKKDYTTSYFQKDLTLLKKNSPTQLDLFA